MSVLLTADLHFTDRPKDSYRFDLFDKMRQYQNDRPVDATFILGDLTDAKDKHSAKLVNKIVDGLRMLQPPLFILQGNHDYIDIGNPFFKFVSGLPGITFITETDVIYPVGQAMPFLCIPHQKDGWPNLKRYLPNKVNTPIPYVLIHQCVEGAIAESGARMNGLSTAAIEAVGARRILAGDIHRPQDVGAVAYVGAPYNIRFGDDFDPRLVLLNEETDKMKSLYFDFPRKRLLKIGAPEDIREAESADLVRSGDQVKVQVRLTREEIVDWQSIKKRVLKECDRIGVQVFGVRMEVERTTKRRKRQQAVDLKSPGDILKGFCDYEKLASDYRRVGERILEG